MWLISKSFLKSLTQLTPAPFQWNCFCHKRQHDHNMAKANGFTWLPATFHTIFHFLVLEKLPSLGVGTPLCPTFSLTHCLFLLDPFHWFSFSPPHSQPLTLECLRTHPWVNLFFYLHSLPWISHLVSWLNNIHMLTTLKFRSHTHLASLLGCLKGISHFSYD